MDGSGIAVIIPALNESRSISDVVRRVLPYGVTVVVDDGSTDDTGELAAAAGALVVSHSRNLGYDAALNTGFSTAYQLGCKVLITLDADGQHDAGRIVQFIDAVEQGADVVIGQRHTMQRFSESLFSLFTRFRFGIRDPLCGMKAYRADVFRELGHFDSFGSIGTELALFAARQGRVVKQVPITVSSRIGPSRFGSISADAKILRALFITMWRSFR